MMPSYLKDDLKEVEISKQRVLEELASLGLDVSLIDASETLASLEVLLGTFGEMVHDHPTLKDNLAAIVNLMLEESRAKQ
jgi:hypothetical protein